ncbi:MAG: beta-lactamase family protein [Bacteroidales bacterium]|nr:beta-lactamase family protein [Bacteroidales bacterium]
MSISTPIQQKASIQAVLNQVCKKGKIKGTSFSIKYQNETWHASGGNLLPNQPFFIASTSKLFVTALIMQLRAQDKLKLDDPAYRYFEEDVFKNLHIYKGTDYSKDITIRQLLAHTSGLPDYFEDKNDVGISLEDELLSHNDKYWNFEDVLDLTRSLPAKFPPGKRNKAHYSDTNYQLLGQIIEGLLGKSFADACDEYLIQPLELTQTYCYTNPDDQRPALFYYKDKELRIPLAMSSFGPDGGIVSTAPELLIFIEGFFTGKFFPVSYLEEMKVWNRIFYPLQSGAGIHRFKLPWLFNPTGTIPELIGHSGLSGAMAYANPERGLYLAGTVNQVAWRDSSFRTAIKLIQQIL